MRDKIKKELYRMITCSEIPIPPGYASNMNICHMAPNHATENKVKQEVFSSQVYV
jgi:hypothetical protein